MTIHKFLIAGGNATALVQGCPASRRTSLAANLLREVEQVGFMDVHARPPFMEMMGGELCINATLAFASHVGPAGRILVSGSEHPISFENTSETTRAAIPLQWSMTENLVLLEGIGFVLHPQSAGRVPAKNELAELCATFGLPAFGAIFYSGEAITPYVYVAAMDSYVPETACGSGSVAYSLFSGREQIRQPTGRIITVHQATIAESTDTGRNTFEIEARVEPAC